MAGKGKVTKKSGSRSVKKKVKKHSYTMYNLVQIQLKEHVDKEGVKLGRKFNSVASQVYRNLPKDSSSQDLKAMIPALYNKVGKRVLKVNKVEGYPSHVAFFDMVMYLNRPIFDKVGDIHVDFSDRHLSLDFDTNRDDFSADFKDSGLYSHCRQYYSEDSTNWAEFVLTKEYDGDLFYKLVPGVDYSTPDDDIDGDGDGDDEVITAENLEQVIQKRIDKVEGEKGKVSGGDIELAKIASEEKISLAKIAQQTTLKKQDRVIASLEKMFVAGKISEDKYFEQLAKYS